MIGKITHPETMENFCFLFLISYVYEYTSYGIPDPQIAERIRTLLSESLEYQDMAGSTLHLDFGKGKIPVAVLSGLEAA